MWLSVYVVLGFLKRKLKRKLTADQKSEKVKNMLLGLVICNSIWLKLKLIYELFILFCS